jgi:23S rRNA (pseudouridine1915-N3)-methyltransferase
LKLALHYFTRGRCDWADEAAADYSRRLNRYAPFEERKHKPATAADRATARRKEAQRVLEKVAPRDRLVVLDERGATLSSEGLSKLIEQAALDGVGTLTFAIGGPYGHHEDLRIRAHRVIKLSDMVLNHQLARVLLLEQLYRGWTILRNEPYHHT